MDDQDHLAGLEAEAATYELTEAGRRGREEQEKLLHEFELRRKLHSVVVPTDDGAVRQMLRQLEEPITLFGEREMERRERLRRIIAERDLGDVAGRPGQIVVEHVVTQHKELFYTEGDDALKSARKDIAQWSLKRAAQRVRSAKRKRDDLEQLKELKSAQESSESAAKRIAQQSSEIGDNRSFGAAVFSPDGSTIATCNWGGMVDMWDASNCHRSRTFRCHDERATDVVWHPYAMLSQSEHAANLATGMK
eukprot:jgi/Chrzof1/9238/Cz03g40300.t1